MQLEQLSAKQAALEQAAHGAKVQELGKRHASAVSQLTQRLSKLEHTLGMAAAELGMGGAVARARADVVGRRIDALATELGLELPTAELPEEDEEGRLREAQLAALRDGAGASSSELSAAQAAAAALQEQLAAAAAAREGKEAALLQAFEEERAELNQARLAEMQALNAQLEAAAERLAEEARAHAASAAASSEAEAAYESRIERLHASVGEMEEALRKDSEVNRAALSELQARLSEDRVQALENAKAQVAVAQQALVRRAESAEEALRTLRQATADRVATLQREAIDLEAQLRRARPDYAKRGPRKGGGGGGGGGAPPRAAEGGSGEGWVLPPEYAAVGRQVLALQSAVLRMLHPRKANELRALLIAAAEAPLAPWGEAEGGEGGEGGEGEAPDAGGAAVAQLRADARRLEELCEVLRGFRPPGTAAAFPPAAKGAKVTKVPGPGPADTAPASRRSAWVGAAGISPQCISLPPSASASALPSSQGGAGRPHTEQQRIRPRAATGVGAMDQSCLAAAGGAEPGGEPGALPSPPAQHSPPKVSQREVASAAAQDRVALGRGADPLPRPRSQPAIAQARYSRSLPSSRGASRSSARAEGGAEGQLAASMRAAGLQQGAALPLVQHADKGRAQAWGGASSLGAPLGWEGRPADLPLPPPPPPPPQPQQQPPRSFWAEGGDTDLGDVALPGAPPSGFVEATRAAEAAAARALLSGATADLDALALALVRVLGTAPASGQPALLEAARAAGLQQPPGGGEPSMASPTRRDVAALLVELQASTAAPTALEPRLASAGGPRAAVSEAEAALEAAKRMHAGKGGAEATQVQLAAAALRYRKLELDVAELKQQLATRPPSVPSPVSPRFSQMALSLVRREEQLQLARAQLRSRRAQTATELDVVRKQLAQYGPKDRVHAALVRMEAAHVQSAQRWEYKREELLHSRTQLLEQAMDAFMIIGKERPASPSQERAFRSLLGSPAPAHAPDKSAPPLRKLSSRVGARREVTDDESTSRPTTVPAAPSRRPPSQQPSQAPGRRPITSPITARGGGGQGDGGGGPLPSLRPGKYS